MLDPRDETPVPVIPNALSLWGAPLISLFSLVIFLIALVVAYLMQNETLLTAMFGVAAANATAVVNFWIGSSLSSYKKDAIIADHSRSQLLAQQQNLGRQP